MKSTMPPGEYRRIRVRLNGSGSTPPKNTDTDPRNNQINFSLNVKNKHRKKVKHLRHSFFFNKYYIIDFQKLETDAVTKLETGSELNI